MAIGISTNDASYYVPIHGFRSLEDSEVAFWKNMIQNPALDDMYHPVYILMSKLADLYKEVRGWSHKVRKLYAQTRQGRVNWTKENAEKLQCDMEDFLKSYDRRLARIKTTQTNFRRVHREPVFRPILEHLDFKTNHHETMTNQTVEIIKEIIKSLVDSAGKEQD